ncbi:MAG: alpha/beta hydrolase [Sphingomonadales bacterium]|nr:MAG: alpha/beta hydrolase [Sphingomonadales bacterium]
MDLQSIPLATGVTLDVAIAGDPAGPALIFLHGFPESHRTWRHQIAEFARDHYVVAPDQRGFARSSKPEGVENYTPDKPVADLLALADHLGIGDFTLVGHDWGGAISWMAALQNPGRIRRLIIVNAPHPLVFQRSLYDDPAQREASQYMSAFRNPGFETFVESLGIPGFFDTTFSKHANPQLLAPERDAYIDEWSQPGAMTAMLNWYRASAIIVPAPGETPERPAWLDGPFPPVTQPTLVIWGTGDKALLPVQLEGLDALVPDLTIARVDAGHFVPWENPQAVSAAMRDWLALHP